MKIKLGIIGEKDTINPYYFTYVNKIEVIDILLTYQNNIDVIFFSGSDPYYYAKNINAIIKPAVYIPRVETNIYEVLWKIRDEELVSFHYDLWKNNKINAAVTGISGAAKKLRELGVPALRLYPTIPLIRE